MLERRSILAFTTLVALLGLVVPSLKPQPSLADGDSATAVAHSEHIEMAVKAGFGKLEANSFSGNWVPFRVLLSNTDDPVSGRIVVSAKSPPSPNSQLREFVKEIQLPSGSQPLHEIPVFLNSGEDVSVTLESNGRVLLGTTLKVDRTFQSDQLSIAVLDTDSTTLNSINAFEIFRSPNRDPFKFGPAPVASPDPSQSPSGASAGQSPQQTAPPPRRGRFRSNQQGPSARPVVIPPEELPRDSVSYDSLDAVVLAESPLSQLTEDQARALRFWVASGGLLVVTGATDFSGLRSSGLNDLMPVEVLGGITADSIPELTETYGRFESSDALPLMGSRPRAGARTLLGTIQQPLVAEKYYGSGLVRFVAFNPKVNPYRAWAAGKNLWSDILLPAAEEKARPVNWITMGRRGPGNSGGVQDFLFRLADIQPPSANYFLLFLLAYLLTVGPINYLVLRWLKKTDLAWLTIPAVVLVFTTVSVSVAQMSRGGRSIAADASLVEVHQPEGISRALTALLIMPTSPGDERLVFEGNETFAHDAADFTSSSTSGSEPIQYSRAPGAFELTVPMNTWKSSIFKVRSVADGGKPVIAAEEVKVEAGAASVRVKNLGGHQISKAVYVSAAGVSQPFDLGPGEQQQFALTPVGSLAAGSFSSWYLSQLGQESREGEVYSDFAAALDREIGGQAVFSKGFFESAAMQAVVPQLERPLLIGFADEGAIGFDFSSSLKRHSKSLYVIHL